MGRKEEKKEKIKELKHRWHQDISIPVVSVSTVNDKSLKYQIQTSYEV
jgi:hypothetical protein